MKLCQAMCGMSPNSIATHPCYICTWNRMDVFKNNCSELRKLRSLRFNNEKSNGSKKLKAKEYFNCVEEFVYLEVIMI